MIIKKSQLDPLEAPHLTVSQWRDYLTQIGSQAHRKVTQKFEGELTPEMRAMKEEAAKIRNQVGKLWAQIKASVANSKDEGGFDLQQDGNKVVVVGDSGSYGGRYNIDEEDGRGRGRSRGRGTSRDGSEIHVDQDNWGSSPPIGSTIDLESPVWSGLSPRARGVISFNQFRNTGAGQLARALFGRHRKPKQEVDQDIMNFLRRNDSAFADASRYKLSFEDGQSFVSDLFRRKGVKKVPLRKLVDRRKVDGKSYMDLYRIFGRANHVEMFKEFIYDLQSKISEVRDEMYSAGDVPAPYLKTADVWAPRWEGVLSAKLNQLR